MYNESELENLQTTENLLTHCSLETPKRVIGKQCIPLFANSLAIFL